MRAAIQILISRERRMWQRLININFLTVWHRGPRPAIKINKCHMVQTFSDALIGPEQDICVG